MREALDEDFFLHMEEIDLCWRAFNQNLNVFSLYKSKVYHLGAGTLKPSQLLKKHLLLTIYYFA